MTKHEELYWLLEAYMRGEYDEKLFCDVFTSIFYPNTSLIKFKSKSEYTILKNLAEVCSRFSPYEEDFKNCKNAFYNEKHVRVNIKKAYKNLCKTNKKEK